jgi:hypothetical protein
MLRTLSSPQFIILSSLVQLLAATSFVCSIFKQIIAGIVFSLLACILAIILVVDCIKEHYKPRVITESQPETEPPPTPTEPPPVIEVRVADS